MKRMWIVIGVLALTGAACGGSDEDDGTADAESTLAAEDAAVAGTPGDDLDACQLLSSDEVADAVGFAVETATSNNTLASKCTFELVADGTLDIDLRVYDGASDSHERLVAREGSVMLAGIGVDAAYVPTLRVVSVDLGGGRYLEVGVTGGMVDLADPGDELTELAELAVSRL